MTFNSVYDPNHLYFITASLCGWKHLFIKPKYAEIILQNLAWMRQEKRIFLYAFVLMPSHLHAILKPRAIPIGAVLQQFGSFTAHAILKQLKADQEQELLAFFQANKRDQRHEHSLWQDIQAKNIFSRKFLVQKLEYIHNNPINKEWHLAENRSEYCFSSACFYDDDRPAIIELDDIRDYL